MNLSNASLNQVETYFKDGKVSRAEVTAYLREWNAGPHFTQAVIFGRSILNFEPKSFPAYLKRPDILAEFAVRL